ncbi:hypothetical protein MRBLMA1_003003 [Sphingobium sp. LMA1-1-1.1]|uniref:hypothetical protein n=1 Tax=unclassified Sphingobium TaxID=2611147 RepID=UPI00343A8659
MNSKQKVTHDMDRIFKPLLHAVGETAPAMAISLSSVTSPLSVFFKAASVLGDTKMATAFTGHPALYGYAMASRDRGLS